MQVQQDAENETRALPQDPQQLVDRAEAQPDQQRGCQQQELGG